MRAPGHILESMEALKQRLSALARHWDIDEAQALAWVHTNSPQLQGAAGQAGLEATEAGEALRERALAFYYEAINARQLPRRRTGGSAAVTLCRTEGPMPPPAQTCADRRRKRDAFGRVRDGKVSSHADLYWKNTHRSTAKRNKRSS